MTKMHSQSFYVYSLQEQLSCLSLFMKAGSSSKGTAGIRHQCHFSISTGYTSLSAFFLRLKLPKGSSHQAGLLPAAAGTGTPWKLRHSRAVTPDFQPRNPRESSPRETPPVPAHRAARPAPKSPTTPCQDRATAAGTAGEHLQELPLLPMLQN